ncbi:MAG: protein translocase subunit SecD [Candidatus Liptonbacteria bacterium]
MQKNAVTYFVLIVLLAVAAGFFVYPKSPIGSWRPWRLGLDLVGGTHLVYNVDLSNVGAADQDSVLNGLRDVIERRVNLFGVSEPQVYTAKSGTQSQLVVELAGIRNIGDAIKQIGETPLLDFREVVQDASATSTQVSASSSGVNLDLGNNIKYIPTRLTGRYITSAQLTFNSTTQAPEVSLQFNDEGAKIFEDITGRNIGKPLAIFLDNSLIEQPTVQTRISGGQAVITGKFTVDQARTLVGRFNAGALPAPISLVDQLSIDPALGSNSLTKAIVAGAVGTALVMVFMMAYYGLFGLFASLALIIYIAFTLSVFKLVPVTMTLAGLAGFVITIGMAVDANILIFERVKEEAKRGVGRAAAIHEGFHRAWPSIRDSNTSSILTAIILYFFTSSFVKGFALTLLIGVIVSMFSAITTTRLFLIVFGQAHTKNTRP